MEFTVENLKESDEDSFIEQMKMVLEVDIRLFYKILQVHGYDLWLEKVALVGDEPVLEGIAETLSN